MLASPPDQTASFEGVRESVTVLNLSGILDHRTPVLRSLYLARWMDLVRNADLQQWKRWKDIGRVDVPIRSRRPTDREDVCRVGVANVARRRGYCQSFGVPKRAGATGTQGRG